MVREPMSEPDKNELLAAARHGSANEPEDGRLPTP